MLTTHLYKCVHGTPLSRQAADMARQSRMSPAQLVVMRRKAQSHPHEQRLCLRFIQIRKSNTQELLGEKRRRSARQVRATAKDKCWNIWIIGRRYRDG
jgi:hypothetical protein